MMRLNARDLLAVGPGLQVTGFTVITRRTIFQFGLASEIITASR